MSAFDRIIGYLDKLAAELIEKETLLNSDIARIRATCTIKPAIVG